MGKDMRQFIIAEKARQKYEVWLLAIIYSHPPCCSSSRIVILFALYRCPIFPNVGTAYLKALRDTHIWKVKSVQQMFRRQDEVVFNMVCLLN